MIVTHAMQAPPQVSSPGDVALLRLRLIGQMEAWTLSSESILPPGRKTRALLAIIALSAPRPMLRTRLAELLWSRRPEEQARASLRQEIHRLLDVLSAVGQAVLSITRDSLTLRPGVVWVDVDEILSATSRHPASLALLDGELLESLDGVDPAFDLWLAAERERLRDRVRGVAEALLRQQESPDSLIAVAQQLLSIDKAHEGAWRALMRAHAERGERGMAVQSYERCRAVLADMMDAAPSPETQELLAEIRAGRPSLPAVPEAPAPVVRPAPLPPLAPAPVLDQEAHIPASNGARIGLLPFALIGTEETEAHLALGLAEEIGQALMRFRWMSLVSPSAISQSVAPGRDDDALRRAFGLDYVLDGSVQKAGRRMRVAVRLVDLHNGSQVVWARRYDRPCHDLLALQDEVAAEVAGQIEPEILLGEARRAARRPASGGTAYRLLLEAVPVMIRLARPQFDRAGDLLRRAIALEPSYASARAWYAVWLSLQVGQGWAADAADAMAEAAHQAEEALTLDPQDARGFAVAGHLRARFGHRLPEAAVLHERALTLNPNLAMAWALAAQTQLYLGDVQEACRMLDRYKRLSPFHPDAFVYDVAFSTAALLRRDHPGAVAAGRTVSELNPTFAAACKPYLAALGHLGQQDEAAVVRRRLLSIDPSFTVGGFMDASPFRLTADRDHIATGLRLAGIPEGADALQASPAT